MIVEFSLLDAAGADLASGTFKKMPRCKDRDSGIPYFAVSKATARAGLKCSSFAKITQAIRAILFANATVVLNMPILSFNANIQLSNLESRNGRPASSTFLLVIPNL